MENYETVEDYHGSIEKKVRSYEKWSLISQKSQERNYR